MFPSGLCLPLLPHLNSTEFLCLRHESGWRRPRGRDCTAASKRSSQPGVNRNVFLSTRYPTIALICFYRPHSEGCEKVMSACQRGEGGRATAKWPGPVSGVPRYSLDNTRGYHLWDRTRRYPWDRTMVVPLPRQRGQYASSVHAGALSCFLCLLLVRV